MSLLPLQSAAEVLALAERRKRERSEVALPTAAPAPLVPVAAAVQLPGVVARTSVAYTERRAGKMNKTELRYSGILEDRRLAGEVRQWDYEAMKLRLADRAWWTPDFRVVLADGTVELHEVKGRAKSGRYYATEKGRLKLRVAAELHPFRILVTWPLADGGWGQEVQGARTG